MEIRTIIVGALDTVSTEFPMKKYTTLVNRLIDICDIPIHNFLSLKRNFYAKNFF